LNKYIDVLIIGSGQAGLTMGYYLKQTDRSFVLVDASKRIGDVWRNRYDSLVLFSPRRYSSLPGMTLPGNLEGFPTKDEFADYLENYAKHFSIPIQLQTKVEKLEKLDDKYRAVTSKGDFIAKNVVIATGPFHKPFTPQLQGTLSRNIYQIHSSEYHRPSQLSEGSVLVVGAGNSGSQIAVELSNSRKVYLSTTNDIKFVPHRILNRSIFWWYYALRLSKISVDSKFAKYLKYEPVIGTKLQPLLKSGKVELKPRTHSLNEQEITFVDDTKIAVDNIIWATGFQYDFHWVDIPDVFDHQKKPIHKRGISPIKGIYFLGLHWLYRRDSAQISGIGFDAKYLFDHLQ
jgi:putative flavoprotein involved in K+ transport